MYLNVKAEMVRTQTTLDKLCKYVGCTQSTLSLKLNGKAPITIDECKSIQKALHSNLTLDELFKKKDEN